ncbi:sodium:calcium antiporter [Rhodovulum sp. BSW8]|uniref:calcium/sodium antiporter n=1 Tax=Rhodovulum sp. BSW8 TaxID=2259645 RepID=UPI000DE1FE35|nr:calcium/sodium antiporter [Rhodovulum sp. BSW8]RBO54998.1 sodium:calcium antiporter [Rhodovulum sp. BSW8]
MDIVLVLAGLAALIAGGELLVRGAVALARRFGVSPMIIGLTFVGFGTSTPELVTSLQAALTGAPDIALGNVVGSNIGNILLILGLAALVRPMRVCPAALRRDGGALALATGLAVLAMLGGALGRGAGAAGLALLVAYLAYTIWQERRATTAAGEVYEAEADTLGPLDRPWTALPVLALGLGLTLAGAKLLVAGAVALAAAAGLSEAAIGLTVVAIGTSMPELVTSLMAARRGESGVAIGNVIGSNIFNLLGILGVTALVQPLAVAERIAGFDVWVMLAATVGLILVAWTGGRITRAEGAVLAICYGVYMTTLLLTAAA